MAVKAERVEDVHRIAGAAQRMGQTAVKNICDKWLERKRS
jgi:zinc finger FYVE domain-containing protein 26